VTMAETEAPDARARLTGFGRALRAEGLAVGTGRILTYWRAAVALAPLDRSALYWAGRATLVSRPQDFPIYDRVFDAYFGRSLLDETLEALLGSALPQAPPESEATEDDPDEVVVGLAEELAQEDPEGEAVVRMVASGHEVLRSKSFEQLSERERAAAVALIRRLSVHLPARRSRRLRPARTRGVFDLRRTLRSSMRTEGEPFRRAWRARRSRPRPLVLILDVSGSMSAYARPLMQFGHAAMRAGQRVEVFCFGTRLTRVTRALRATDPDKALATVASVVEDWEGGTRIGDSIKHLLDSYGHHAAIRGSVVVLCSDGLERGDPALLEAQMGRLARLAHRVVWVNPLKGGAAYEPLARGMAAALPHIDLFLPGHNIASLEHLGAVLSG
jgi:uncharacterized protein with von Willebrand factor type A (vWA) domain